MNGGSDSSQKPLSIERVKVLALIAMVSDDALMERLVLKGGNAIDLIYRASARPSVDLDFSIAGDFGEPLEELQGRFRRLLEETFLPIGYRAFDVTFEPRPASVSPELEAFWGGYRLAFKIIDAKRDFGDGIKDRRRLAAVVGPSQRRTFEVDISRFEFCDDKTEHFVDGFKVYAYSPRLIIAEKLRAICQQMPEYRKLVKSSTARPRARDFVDIRNLSTLFRVNTDSQEFADLLSLVFDAKRVPRELLSRIVETREYHREDFQSVRDTVLPGVELLTFDDYFDFVVRVIERLEPPRHE